jgi:hypothetical protein
MLLAGQRLDAQGERTAVLNAERAMAERSRDSGLAEALLGGIHRDGILLWPGAPVAAGTAEVKLLLARLQTEPLQLTWRALGIEVARDSSLAATWGVAVASAERKRPAPEIGSYIAAWRRDGARWTLAALVFAGLRRLPEPVLSGEIPLTRRSLSAAGNGGPFVAADLEFARLAGDSGAGVAFERWAAPQAVTFGDGGLLTYGPKAIGGAVDFPAAWQWHPVAAGGAGSGDLGWTAGEAIIAGKDAAPAHSKYLTIWARSGNGAVRFLTDGGNARPAPH